MSPINKLIINFLVFFCFSFYSQDIMSQESEAKQNRIQASLLSAQKSIHTYKYLQAQQYLEKALEIAIKRNDKNSQGLIYSKMGELNYILKASEAALKMLTKAREFHIATNDFKGLAKTNIIQADVYVYINDYSKALDYYERGETYFNQEKLYNYEAETILKKGRLLMLIGEQEKAIKTFEKALVLAKSFKLNKTLSASLLSLADSKISSKQELDQIIINANEGLDIAKKNNFYTILSRGYLTMSKLYEADNNIELSNSYLKRYIKLSDSLLKAEKTNLFHDKKQFLVTTEIQALKQEKNSLETTAGEAAINQLTTMLTIALIAILSLLTLSLYKNSNIRLKSNKILQKKNDELVIAMEKAELASKTKANFLSTVTHELRTPLYAVTGLTNMLLDENPKPDQVQHLKSLKFSGDYLLTFINDILQINKIEANKVDVVSEVFDLEKKITNIISALNNSALYNNIKMHLEYDTNLPLNYNADQIKISQILINLIGNSIKFTKDGDIWVRAKKINENNGLYTIRFEIEDNGIGISEEKQLNMFESFSQGSTQINRKYGGTGLGLSIVKGLIEILKGKIYLKSKLGEGSTFYFELPMQHSLDTIVKKEINYFENISDEALSKVKILVVEDNRINQMITKKILTKMKLDCEVVDNGETAVDRIKNTNYNIVLMDIHMPGISGIEATKIIRTFNKDLTIFALTAVTIEDKIKEFEEAGFTDVISKPFKQEDFERKLFEALVKPKMVS